MDPTLAPVCLRKKISECDYQGMNPTIIVRQHNQGASIIYSLQYIGHYLHRTFYHALNIYMVIYMFCSFISFLLKFSQIWVQFYFIPFDCVIFSITAHLFIMQHEYIKGNSARKMWKYQLCHKNICQQLLYSPWKFHFGFTLMGIACNIWYQPATWRMLQLCPKKLIEKLLGKPSSICQLDFDYSSIPRTYAW